MEEDAPVATPEDVPVAIPGDAPMSAREAGRLLASFRKPRDPEPSPLVAAVTPETPEPSEQPVEAAPETEPGEQAQAVEPAEDLPSIEPPRSWSREWKEEFQNYPREAQEKIAAREQERETALRRGQNEAAELRKANEAERTQLEQARKQYEEALPVMLAALQQQQMGEFADIKTQADIENLARTDWPRYALWDAKQKQVQAVQAEMRAGQERQAREYQTQWNKFSADEDAKFIERAPEMSDETTAGKVRNASISLLKDLGFSEEDLGKLWSGQASISLRDHRAQLLIRDAVRYREAKAAVPKAAVKTVPKVQRPGSPAQRVPDADAQERAIINRLDETRGLAAARLGAQLIAQRRSQRQ